MNSIIPILSMDQILLLRDVLDILYNDYKQLNKNNKDMITLATLEQATAQEVFDQVVKHLLTQNEVSLTASKLSCAYRSLEGLKCAAGCFISDEEYNPGMENNIWDNLIELKVVPALHGDLIRSLQLVHDCYDPSFWESELQKVAVSYSLNFNK